MTKLLVTGASGHLGRLTLDALLASGKIAATDIIAVSRDPAKLAEYTAKGVDTRAGDFDKPETLTSAFSGADVVAIISVDFPNRVQRHSAAIEAAKAAGASHILYTSLAKVDGVPVTFGDDHFATEEVIAASGLAHTVLRNGWYSENLFMNLPRALKTGQWVGSEAQGRASYAPRQAYAEALAAAMISAGTENRVFTLTGTELYSVADIVALANKVFGTSIAVIDITDEQLAEGMKQSGLPDFLVPVLVSMSTNVRNGGLDIITDDMEKLTGKKPLDLESFLTLSKDALRDAAK